MMLQPNSAEGPVVDNCRTADVGSAVVVVLDIVVAEVEVVHIAVAEAAGVVTEAPVEERTAAAKEVAADSVAVAERADDTSPDLVGLVAEATEVAVVAQMLDPEFVRRSRNSPPGLLRVKRLVGWRSG